MNTNHFFAYFIKAQYVFLSIFLKVLCKGRKINYRLEEEEEFMQNVMYNSYKLYCAISMFIDYGSCRRA